MLNAADQAKWRHEHIPRRVRVAIAHSDMRHTPLDVITSINVPLSTRDEQINWRCAGDAIWEARLTATRWLIYLVGARRKGKPKDSNHPKDIDLTDFDGGEANLFDRNCADAQFLIDIWKGCSQASSHPTNDSNHPDVREGPLAQALTIIVKHLQTTIYEPVGEQLREFVLRLADE